MPRGSLSIVLAGVLLAGVSAFAAAPPPDEREVQALLEKGAFTPEQSQAARAALDRAAREGLPAAMLVQRIREGLARRAPVRAILGVVEDRLGQLQRADEILRKAAARGLAVRDREHALLTLADAFALGVTPGDAQELLSSAISGRTDALGLARAAEALGRLAQKGFPPKETRDVVAAALASAWPPDKMGDVVGLFLRADALHLSPEETRERLLAEVRRAGDPSASFERRADPAEPGAAATPRRDKRDGTVEGRRDEDLGRRR